LPLALQRSHCPVHSLVQHTPSTHRSVPHCDPALQSVPTERRHSPRCPASAHVLPAGHEAEPQHTPSTHEALSHWPSALQFWPFSRSGAHVPPSQ
jgi:hypothetical protein